MRSCIFALGFALVCAIRLAAQTETTNPDSARIVMSDVARFWTAFDVAGTRDPGTAFDSLYLSPGTAGLRDFARMRIGGASALGAAVRRDSVFYRGIRPATLSFAAETTAVRTAFRSLHALDEAAVFPDVYFVIGRRNAAGTVSNAGVLIALEKLASGDAGLSLALAPAVVAHEVVHYQQRIAGRTLLAMALREGGADFIAELGTGMELNRPAHEWLRAHEREAWALFQRSMASAATDVWFETPPEAGWPGDLAYAIGYSIARRYYDAATDKRAAVRETFTMPDAVAYLGRSGYGARVDSTGNQYSPIQLAPVRKK